MPDRPKRRSLLDELLDEEAQLTESERLFREVLDDADLEFRKKRKSEYEAEKARRDARSQKREKKTSDAEREQVMTQFVEQVVRSVDKATEGGTDNLIKQLDELLDDLLAAGRRADLSKTGVLGKLKLRPKERKFLEEAVLSEDWRRLRAAAQAFVETFMKPRTAKSRKAAISSLKGTVAEILFFRTPAFRAARKRAIALAKRLGIDTDKTVVRLIRVARGEIIQDGSGGLKELTDGMLVVELPGNQIRVLTVFEMKSPSNFKDLVRRRERKKSTASGEILQRAIQKEGQFSSDFERLSETIVELDGTKYLPGQLKISKKDTEWIAVIPKDKKIPPALKERLTREIPNFTLEHHELNNKTMDTLSEELLKLVSGLDG